MYNLFHQRSYPQKILFLLFLGLGFLSIFGDGSPLPPSSCPPLKNYQYKDKIKDNDLPLPQLKLWRRNASPDHPGEEIIVMDLNGTGFGFKYGREVGEVESDELEISCTAPYPTLFVTLMASDNEEEFRMSSMGHPTPEQFKVYQLPESEPHPGKPDETNLKVHLRPGLKSNRTVFENRAFSPLKLIEEQSVSVFACEAMDNPCLGSAGKLVFTNHGRRLGSPKFNVTITMAENLLPHLHPFLTSSHRSLPLANKRNNTDYSTRPHAESECDAIFYYQVVERKPESRIMTSFYLAYTCKFVDGSPGFFRMHRCSERGRCSFPQSREQTVKNCWRQILPGETCKNCPKMTTELELDLNIMAQFVPFCVSRGTGPMSSSKKEDSELHIKKEDMADGNRVVKGTPLYVGFPSGFNISRPHIRTWDDGENGQMIRMHIFEEVQLLDSVLNITCDSSYHYTAKGFAFALKIRNKTELEFLTITNASRIRILLIHTEPIFRQTVSLHLNSTVLELNVERVFCFAPVQNSWKLINSSRPIRLVPHVQDLFKPLGGECTAADIQYHSQLGQLPNLVRMGKAYRELDWYFGRSAETGQLEEPFDDQGDQGERVECEAKYPIELLHTSIYQPGSHINRGGKYSVENWQYELMLNKEKIGDAIEYQFSTKRFNLQAKNYSHFFRCQSIENPCLHRSFQFFHLPRVKQSQNQNQSGEDQNEKLMLRLFPLVEEDEPILTESEDESSVNQSHQLAKYLEECEFIFLYKEIPDFPGYEFRCESALEQKGKINFYYCDSLNECGNTLRHRRQSPKCWQKVEEWGSCDYRKCGVRRADGLRPFVATCSTDRTMLTAVEARYQESALGSFAVFGLLTKPRGIAPIFFSEEEIDPREMTFLEPFDPYQFPGAKLTVTCRVSAYFNFADVGNVQILKNFSDGEKFKFLTGPFPGNVGQWASLNVEWHHWSLSMTIDLGNNTDLSHIVCIGLHWKGSNSSREIYLHAPESPKVALHVKDLQGEHTIVQHGQKLPANEGRDQEELFQLSSTNVFLDCHGFGYPPPEISWDTTAANKLNTQFTVVNATHAFSRIIFPVIDVGVEGTYTCTAQNQVGDISSRVKVGIKYPVSTTVLVISTISSIFVVGFILTLFVFVRRVRRLKHTLRDLSDEEVEQFHQGDKTVDPTDQNAEIYALAYDQSLEVSPDLIEIDEEKVLGAGEFGIVRPGILKSDSDLDSKDGANESGVRIRVAVKMPKLNVTTENFKSFLYEIKIMAFVQNHENVLKILGASTITIKKRRALIALEFCELGNLKNFLRGKKDKFRNEFQILSLAEDEQMDFSGSDGSYSDPWSSLPQSERLETVDLLNFSLGIANGMSFLQEKKVIHGDLAARNVLLTQNREVKISDFGFSTQLKNYQTYTNTNSLVIPWRWFPLEALVDRKFSLKSDVWSFGILLYEIFSLGEDPYPGFDRLEPKFVQSLRDGHRSEMPEFANGEMYDLMSECWLKDPNDRPSFSQICEKILDLSREIVEPKLNLI